jgi:hypothetical protein
MPKPQHKPPDNVIALSPHPNTPPRHLEPQEQALWRSITRTYALDDVAGLSILDTAMQAHQRMRRCRETIEEQGELVKDRWGQSRANPLLVSERGARDSFLKSLRLLNLDIGGKAR